MSPFTVNNTSFASKIVHVPLVAVLKVLHDPVALIKLGSLATGYTVDPTDANLYHVTDTISFLGCFHTETNFKARFTTLEDGMISDVDANFGTRVRSQWKARSIEGGTQVEVETSIKVGFIVNNFMPSSPKSSAELFRFRTIHHQHDKNHSPGDIGDTCRQVGEPGAFLPPLVLLFLALRKSI